MAQVPNNSLYAYQDGLVVTAAQLNQDIQVLQSALNDNYYRLLRTINVNGTAYQVQGTAGVANVLNITSDTTIKITSSADTSGNINLALSVAPTGITGSQIANNTVTAQQMANKTVTATQIADNTITGQQIENGAIGSTQIASAGVELSNLDTTTVDTRYYPQATVDSKVSSLQSQVTTNANGVSTNATNLSNHISSTSAHAASNITETRMGNAQSALNDLNSRLASAITAGSVSEVGDAHNSIPLSTSYATLKARLDSMDLAGVALAQKMLNSGVIEYNASIGNQYGGNAPDGGVNTMQNSAGYSGNTNTFWLARFNAVINGMKHLIQGSVGSTNTSTINLDAPPASNVTPSLAGSARDDLVFLEAWRDATTSEWAWRIRVVDGVDFGTYAEGLSTPSNSTQGNGSQGYNSAIIPQGGLSSVPNSLPTGGSYFANTAWRKQNGTSQWNVATDDQGLYVASPSSGNPFNTYDNYVFAIPLFRVRRRNSTAFDPDTNPMGGKQYFSVNGTASWTAGQSTMTFTVSAGLPASLQVGDYVSGVSNDSADKVTAISGNTATIQLNYTNGNTGSNTGAVMRAVSDRPDGLYSNIIDASDIIDLRHQVSGTGFNYQALLEKNLDLLLRGQLVTSQTQRYSRDYIGLNTTNYTDDANTLLYLKFDGSINGTANGAVVNGTMNTGSASFVNGVQGTALAPSTSQYVSYPVSIASGVNTYTIEMVFKPSWDWNDGAAHSLCAFTGTLNGCLALYKNTSNALTLVIHNGSTLFNAPSFTLPSDLVIRNGDNVKLLLVNNAGNVSAYLQGESIGTSTINALPIAVTNVQIGHDMWVYYYADSAIDLVRVSSVTRTESLLPSGFSYANGDRILDGPNGDFSFWSDDVGGTTGTGGRTNPYGLTHVPNQIAGRISYNGSEIRHYYGQGVTAGYSASSTGSAPTGSFEDSSEFIWVNSNESADGTKTSFTFTKPSNVSGSWLINAGALNNNVVQVNGSGVTPSSISIDANGTVTAVLSPAPASGATVRQSYYGAQRHAHFVPSTKGFIIHDWTDETHTGDGTTTVFTTTKHNVTSVNHVRVNGAIQNGGYTVGTLNQSGAGTTVTFATAPANGATIDIVYESIITPALGDYVRVMYQHVPYQGTGNTGKFTIAHLLKTFTLVSYGTGKVKTSIDGNYSLPMTVQLPIGSQYTDASFKTDNLATSYQSGSYLLENIPTIFNSMGYTTYTEPRVGDVGAFDTATSRGLSHYGGTGFWSFTAPSLSTGVPRQIISSAIVFDNTTEEAYLAVVITTQTGTNNPFALDRSNNCSADLFKLQGRPLIKAYGGVSA